MVSLGLKPGSAGWFGADESTLPIERLITGAIALNIVHRFDTID